MIFFTSDDGKLLRGRHRQADEHEQINDWNQHSRIQGGCEKTTTLRISDNELGDPWENAATRRVVQFLCVRIFTTI